MLFIGNDVENIVKHEYGHYLQLQEMGLLGYVSNVAAPSVTTFWLYKTNKIKYSEYDYHGAPWEYNANERSGAYSSGKAYTKWPDTMPGNFFELIQLFFN